MNVMGICMPWSICDKSLVAQLTSLTIFLLRSLVAQLTFLGISNEDVQGSKPFSPNETIKLSKKKDILNTYSIVQNFLQGVF